MAARRAHATVLRMSRFFGVLPPLLVSLVVSIVVLIQRTGDRPTSRVLRSVVALAETD
jgi:hypothetical protein